VEPTTTKQERQREIERSKEGGEVEGWKKREERIIWMDTHIHHQGNSVVGPACLPILYDVKEGEWES
jgi:hypothetical protein